MGTDCPLRSVPQLAWLGQWEHFPVQMFGCSGAAEGPLAAHVQRSRDRFVEVSEWNHLRNRSKKLHVKRRDFSAALVTFKLEKKCELFFDKAIQKAIQLLCSKFSGSYRDIGWESFVSMAA